MPSAPRFCGSGRAAETCHELPRRERRRHRRSLLALAEAHDISALFPRLRPRDDVLDAFAAEVARGLDPEDPCVPATRDCSSCSKRLPRATAMLEAGCRETTSEDDAAVGVAGFLLASYALAIATGKVEH